MLARGILGSGRTHGVSFRPFPNFSGWGWLISSVFLIRISCHKTTHANGYYGAWPGWAVSICVSPNRRMDQVDMKQTRDRGWKGGCWTYWERHGGSTNGNHSGEEKIWVRHVKWTECRVASLNSRTGLGLEGFANWHTEYSFDYLGTPSKLNL